MCRSELCQHSGVARVEPAAGGRVPSKLYLGARLRLDPGHPASCILSALIVMSLLPSGCQQEMANQPRYEPLEASEVFDDQRSSRLPVPGTIARGKLQLDDAFFTGKVDGELVRELPERALAGRTMAELLTRGRERYGIFCTHCHGHVGGGMGGSEVMLDAVGMVVKRGFPAPPTYHQERLRQAPLGHFFDVITNGLGRMAAHGYLIPPEDRWAIAAYIRALQLSQHAPRDLLSDADFEKLPAENAPQAQPQ
jgi:mono/diheme cytochrome c family protein